MMITGSIENISANPKLVKGFAMQPDKPASIGLDDHTKLRTFPKGEAKRFFIEAARRVGRKLTLYRADHRKISLALKSYQLTQQEQLKTDALKITWQLVDGVYSDPRHLESVRRAHQADSRNVFKEKLAKEFPAAKRGSIFVSTSTSRDIVVQRFLKSGTLYKFEIERGRVFFNSNRFEREVFVPVEIPKECIVESEVQKKTSCVIF